MISAQKSLLDQLIVSGSNFLIVVLAARFLEVGDVAKYAYAFGFYMLLYMFAYAWIYQNVMAIGREELARDEVASRFAGLNILLALFSLPVSIISFQLIVTGELFGAAWIESILVAIFVMVNQLIDFERRILYFTIPSTLANPILVSFTGFLIRVVVLILVQPDSFVEFMGVLIAASLPGLLFGVARLSKAFSGDFRLFVFQQMKNGKWISLDIPVNWIWAHAPVFIIGSFLGLHAAGVYAAVRSIANISNVAMEMIPTYFASKLSYLFTAGQLSEYRKFIIVSIGIGVFAWGGLLIFISMFGEHVLIIILGDTFSKYWFLLLLFWIFNVFIFLIRFQYLHLRFVNKTGIAPISNLIGIFALCCSYFIWFKESGVEGIAWAMIIGAGVITLCQFIGMSTLKVGTEPCNQNKN